MSTPSELSPEIHQSSSLSSLSSSSSSLNSSPSLTSPSTTIPSISLLPNQTQTESNSISQSSSSSPTLINLNQSQPQIKIESSHPIHLNPQSSSNSFRFDRHSISNSHDLSENFKNPAPIDLTKDSSEPPSNEPSSSILNQKLKFGSRQQALALSQAILRRHAEQKDRAPLKVSQFNNKTEPRTPHAHLNIPSLTLSTQKFNPSSTSQHSSHQVNQGDPPSWPHRSHVNSSSPAQPFHSPSITDTSNIVRPKCIGLLSSLVLILYRLKEFEIDLCGPDGRVRPQTLPVRLCRFPPNGTNEILKVLSPTGEQFGVVEHKIGNVIGPLLGPIHSISGGSAVGGWSPNPSFQVTDSSQSTKTDSPVTGKSHTSDEIVSDLTEINHSNDFKVNRTTSISSALDGRQLFVECCVIRRGEQNPMMLPLQLLLFCLPSALPSVSAYLRRSFVILEHPVSYHPEMHLGCLYDNPHSSHNTGESMESLRQRFIESQTQNYSSNRKISQRPVQACDNQQQVATIFKSLTSGVDLDETEPGHLIITPLYPHQKQALSFMLDRETFKVIPEDTKSARTLTEKKALEKEDEENLVSLWQKTRDNYGRHVGWVNVVTGIQHIDRQPPTQCRGALLADDMGLGKTISIISLIATTLEAAIEYAKSPIVQPVLKADHSQKSSQASSRSRNKLKSDRVMQITDTRPTFRLVEKLQDSSVSLPNVSEPKLKKEVGLNAKKRIALQDRFHLIKVKSRATLIVCPLSTVQNWESQIEEHVRKKLPGKDSSSQVAVPSLSVCIYHGNSRTSDPFKLADYDVVITTYSLLGYEFSRQNRNAKQVQGEENDSSDYAEEIDSDARSLTGPEKHEKPLIKKRISKKRKRKLDGLPSPLQAIQWFRVVLDEAHMIKEHTTTQSKAACDLLAERRVCLTGTPLQNSLNDLFSLVCFLRLDPFTDRSVWSTHIGTPARLGEPLGVSRLQLIMRHIALRRTKQTCDKHGKPILTLPPKKDDIVYLELNQSEKEVYSKYHQRSRSTFMSLKNNDTVLKNYCSILQELLRLRQICADVGLVFDSEAQSGKEMDSARRIDYEGFSNSKAIQLLILMRDTGATQCSECGIETISASPTENQEYFEDLKVVNSGFKRGGRKKPTHSQKASANNKVSEEVDIKENQFSSVITKCQHLFCPPCYRERMCSNLRGNESKEDVVECSVCSQQLVVNIDVAEVSAAELQQSLRLEELKSGEFENIQSAEDATKTSNKRGQSRKRKPSKAMGVETISPIPIDNKSELNTIEKRTELIDSSAAEEAKKLTSYIMKQDSTPPELLHGTKINQLILDLLPFSQANPASANYAPNNLIFNQELRPEDPDADFKPIKGAVVKSVVFSQWTKLLDKISIALDEFRIEHRKLDGTMNRAERNQSMDSLKMNPRVEVLLVSLRAGGVGLNLTCAQRVYLMEPFWNPAVENQAVDRVHRLGQTKPVRMIRYIISGSIEQNMLEIQKRKTELANMSLGQTLSKAELAKRRVEDLHILFKENLNSD